MSRFSFILWTILLVGIAVKAYYHLSREQAAAIYVCAPDRLVKNHQVVANDLAGNAGENDTGAYVGQYLLSPKTKGERIDKDDLAASPNIAPVAKDSAIVILGLRDDETSVFQLIDAGAHIYLIPAETSDSLQSKSIPAPTQVMAMQVIAVHRATAKSPGNWLWLQFPVSANQNVAAFAAGQKRIITKALD